MNAALHQDLTVSAIILQGIGKRFDALEVLRDISFEVGQGEVVALLGTSGCGKSTLLNIVSGLLAQDQGRLSLFGQASSAFSDWRRIAYMFQEDRLLPWRSVQANVAFGLEGSGIGKAERAQRVAEALRLVGLEAFAKSWPHQLSGGMRSRVALARSLVVKPQVLLMDEPFSKLDPHTRSQMHDELLRLQALTGMTVLFVTHDVEEAVVLADRVVVLEPRPGRIRAIHSMALPRPRVPTEPAVNEQVRRLRLEV
ncbi:ABC transporter ATP-binding protein [Pseudomonas sp. MM211]|uniref:ABC transporter ATP-binding protein n=1 Tax=Pseudomonas sp. MM211 TaxID=2866808 RepID=UPI001CED0EA5|nr:ABC transporter ATP-binding protein [Pseudomonas sp. MM211]UCJ15597.1 ABC transporter ATP-binding protein [Pseudomonas sp. MM211]